MNILVVCHGNINRSAACAEILRSKIATVKSAGFVGPGKRAAKKMREAMYPKGVNLEDHRSQLITRELVDWADTIIYMDGGNLARFASKFPDMVHKLVCLGQFSDPMVTRIPDPGFMAKGSSEFKKTVELIFKSSMGFLNQNEEHWS